MAAASLLFLIFLSAISSGRAQEKQHNISLHSSLSPNSNLSWVSQSGLFGFGFYESGHGYGVGIFLVGVANKTVVWTANRDSPPVTSDATLVFNGALVLQSGKDQDNVVSPGVPATSASMLDSGNFVLYDSRNDIKWQSFDYPTDTILQGQILETGQELVSSASETEHSTGIFRLKMQRDGNLVQYPVESGEIREHSYYASGTDTAGGNVTLRLEDDGYLYLFDGTNTVKDLSPGGNPTKDTLYLLRIDPDGFLRLYKHNLTDKYSNASVLWQPTYDKCSPRSSCGLNEFCFTINQDARCQCIPGFVAADQGSNTSGCARSFTPESCEANDGRSVKYNIQEVPNTAWEDNILSNLTLPTKDDCKKACLEDCRCEAATFKDGVCRKQRLPLRYGRRDTRDSNVALIKVSASTPTPNIEPSIDEHQGSKKRLHCLNKGVLIVGVVLISLALVFFAFTALLAYRNHAGSYRQVPMSGNRGLTEDVCLRSFSYVELQQVTNNFNEQIGKGAFGTVYKGTVKQLNESMLVAVKRLQSVSEEGEREFQNEIKAIGRTHHRNLVQLLGYCLDRSNRLLVYEYMSNGSLSDALFKPENKPSWLERMEIAKDIARGILYLHEDCERQIIHCDIKPQNILMDELGHARIADFGMAKLLKAEQTRTFTGIRGTRGYMAPEWHKKLRITVKADVYSYGVVLLEIICCRRSVDSDLPEAEAILEDWVHDCFVGGQIGEVVGEDEEVEKRQLERVVKVGLWCVQEDPSIRLSMKKVLLMLEGIVDIPVPPRPS